MLAAKTQTSLVFARLHVTFRPWRGITFCNEQARRIVILNTAPPDFAGEPFFDALQEKSDVQAAGVFYYLCAPITTTDKVA